MKLLVAVGRRQVVVEAPDAPGGDLLIDGEPARCKALLVRPGVYSVIADGRSYEVVLEESAAGPGEAPASATGAAGVAGVASVDGTPVVVRVEDERRRTQRAAPASRGAGPAAGAVATVVAPMPGRVAAVPVEVGTLVEQGQTVVVLEAMKMESALAAPHAGTIVEVLVSPGQTVQQRQPMARVRIGS